MKRAGVALIGLLCSWPSIAQACAACGANAAQRNSMAFLGSTIMLSLLPLGMLGGGLWWLRGKVRDRFPDEFDDRDA